MRTSSATSLLPLALLSASGFVQASSIGKRDLVAPPEFENGWQYQGCYMYVLECIGYCAHRGRCAQYALLQRLTGEQ